MEFKPVDKLGNVINNWNDSYGWVLTVGSDGKYYFWDESQQGPYGPYDTANDCDEGLQKYVTDNL